MIFADVSAMSSTASSAFFAKDPNLTSFATYFSLLCFMIYSFTKKVLDFPKSDHSIILLTINEFQY